MSAGVELVLFSWVEINCHHYKNVVANLKGWWQNSLKRVQRQLWSNFTWLKFSATIFQTLWQIMNLQEQLPPLLTLI